MNHDFVVNKMVLVKSRLHNFITVTDTQSLFMNGDRSFQILKTHLLETKN